MLRLRRDGNINGQEVPEIILLNSHDGSSSYQMIDVYKRQLPHSTGMSLSRMIRERIFAWLSAITVAWSGAPGILRTVPGTG